MPLRFDGGSSSPIGSYVLLIVFLVVSLISVTMYSSEDEDGVLHSVQNGFESITTPFQLAGAGIGSAGNGISTSIDDLTADADTLSELKEQNEQLRNYISELEEYRQEAERLQELQDLVDAYDMTTITCRVIGLSNSSYSRTITLDQGSDAGISAGLPVTGSTGVVGMVISVTLSTSKVRLIQDSQSGVSVLVQSNRAQGILMGSVDGLLYLENVDSDEEVEVGDVIVTSGKGGSYFRGLLVGTVVKVTENDGESDREIVVSPNEDVSALEEVMVVTKMGTSGALDSDTSDDSDSTDE